VRLLRQRLRLSGDYASDMGADPLVFDAGLYDALIAFQNRHGLYPDGAVAGQTLELLNLSVEQRIAQLRQAHDAWRALRSGSRGGNTGRRIWVNIPEAMVSALNDDRIELQLRAVVGHPTRPTPELNSIVSRVVVNPTWTVPQSIAGADILPRQIENPDYLRDNGFRVFGSWTDDTSEMNPDLIAWKLIKADRVPYRLRQDPGPLNSLGRFKFDFPNSFDIYMHDTPSRLLLDLSVRSLSAGCVRVDDPARLAQWLSSPNPVLSKMILTAAEDPSYATRTFAFPQSVPIDFVYLSAWVSADGRTHFRRDVYGRAAATSTAFTAD
jgi:murein L,D-transpeptidase YcbB/YkuD